MARLLLCHRTDCRGFPQPAGVASARPLSRLFAAMLDETRAVMAFASGRTEASVAVGFESLAHYCRAYRQQYGQEDRKFKRPFRHPWLGQAWRATRQG